MWINQITSWGYFQHNLAATNQVKKHLEENPMFIDEVDKDIVEWWAKWVHERASDLLEKEKIFQLSKENNDNLSKVVFDEKISSSNSYWENDDCPNDCGYSIKNCRC